MKSKSELNLDCTMDEREGKRVADENIKVKLLFVFPDCFISFLNTYCPNIFCSVWVLWLKNSSHTVNFSSESQPHMAAL